MFTTTVFGVIVYTPSNTVTVQFPFDAAPPIKYSPTSVPSILNVSTPNVSNVSSYAKLPSTNVTPTFASIASPYTLVPLFTCTVTALGVISYTPFSNVTVQLLFEYSPVISYTFTSVPSAFVNYGPASDTG